MLRFNYININIVKKFYITKINYIFNFLYDFLSKIINIFKNLKIIDLKILNFKTNINLV